MLLSLIVSVYIAEQCGAVTRYDYSGKADLFPEELHARADAERANASLLGRIPTLSHIALHLTLFEKDHLESMFNEQGTVLSILHVVSYSILLITFSIL